MISHRLLMCIAVFGLLVRAALRFWQYGPEEILELSLVVAVLPGFICGCLLAFLFARLVQRRESQGYVNLNLGLWGVVAIVAIAILWFSRNHFVALGVVPSLCSFVSTSIKELNICDAHVGAIWLSFESTFVLLFFTWGLFYERKLRQRLKYVFYRKSESSVSR